MTEHRMFTNHKRKASQHNRTFKLYTEFKKVFENLFMKVDPY